LKKINAIAVAMFMGIGAGGLTITSANAASVIHAASGLISPDKTVDFGIGLFSDSFPITNQFSEPISQDGVLFDQGYGYRSAFNFDSLRDGFIFNTGSNTEPGKIVFEKTVNDAVFSFRSNFTPGTLFTAKLNGVFVADFSGDTDESNIGGNFFGFTGISKFNEIEIDFITGTTVNLNYSIDNLQYNFSPVPIPAALPLFLGALAGLGGLGFMKRRKAAAA